MSAEIKKYKARIFGELYVIVSDEDEEFVTEVVSHVDGFMKEISLKSSGALDAKKIAVLAALRATQELLVLQKRLQKECAHSEKIMMLLDKEEKDCFLNVSEQATVLEL